jgi:hypothetical protein
MNDGICFEVPQLTPTSVVLTPSPLKRQAYSDPMTPPRELLESLLTAAKDPLRLSPLLQAPSGQILEALRRLGLERCRRKTDWFDLTAHSKTCPRKGPRGGASR